LTTTYPKRLIEVDLPIARISAHARREKSIRHGHISTLHIWWARRPLAACRASICASLWPDPVDLNTWLGRGEEVQAGPVTIRPRRFLSTAREQMARRARIHLGKASAESLPRLFEVQKDESVLQDPSMLRALLLDFIADFADWDNSNEPAYLEMARELTHAAHEALGGETGERPLVVDPFAGGGAIPLESLRVGADAFASDLNPVAVFLNKVLLEHMPRYGRRLAEGVREWGERVKAEAGAALGDLYPVDSEGANVIAYLWARTARCEGPGCGAEVPMLSTMWLSERGKRPSGLSLDVRSEEPHVIVTVHDGSPPPLETSLVRRGSAICPVCGHTTSAVRVRSQFAGRRGGADDARLVAVVTGFPGQQGKHYRAPRAEDYVALSSARDLLRGRLARESVPADEPLPYLRSIFNIHLLDVKTWSALFSSRQMLALLTLSELVSQACIQEADADFGKAVRACLACALDRQADYNSSLCRWVPRGEFIGNTFGRQALGIIWDFAEVNPLSHATGSWSGAVEWVARVIEANADLNGGAATVLQASATTSPLPSDSAHFICTDPPYYDLVPYADLSDFFFVWLKRSIGRDEPELFGAPLTPKDQEIVQLAERNKAYAYKTRERYEALMSEAMREASRVLGPSGLGLVFFAHKGTGAWESQLAAMIAGGWKITASWPIDTEMGARLRAKNSAVLASSIQLICRPRENPDGTPTTEVGEWRAVLSELPLRIEEWMPRLASEGVVGADAIFACLGPALEIFSRYGRVEKASGEAVTLQEYLEQVWAAVSKEALSMIFDDPETAGLEPDARLTAMWLWTIGSGESDSETCTVAEDSGTEDNGPVGKPVAKGGGFALEFDAARKIAQGLGIHLEKSPTVVEVAGNKARLLAVAERIRYLFGKDADGGPAARRPNEAAQLDLFSELQAASEDVSSAPTAPAGPAPGATVLDRVHQAMILFGASRGEALRRFLVDEGIGRQPRFWRLAQALSALYPTGSDEKRWVDGVLARKKGLGL